MTITCCKDCGDRHCGCHSTCEKYITQRAALDEYNEQRRKENEANKYVLRTLIECSKNTRYRHSAI